MAVRGGPCEKTVVLHCFPRGGALAGRRPRQDQHLLDSAAHLTTAFSSRHYYTVGVE